MDAPDRCPECGSDELRTTTRKGDIQVVVCGVCDWSSDPRVGRPPADRSKNFTLRRLLAASKAAERTREPILGIEILPGALHDSLPGSVCGLDETSGSGGSGWLSLAAMRMIKTAMSPATITQINHV